MKLLSQIWSKIQVSLFPNLEEALDPLTEKQKQFVTVLEILRIEDYINVKRYRRGKPLKDRKAIARAFVLKAINNLNTTRELIDLLKSSPNLRRLSGFERIKEIPHESSFSRAFEEFARGELPQKVQEALIKRYMGDKLVGHISRDSSVIKGREKAKRHEKVKEQNKPKRKRGRPGKDVIVPPKVPTRLERQLLMSMEEMIKDLPKDCDKGCKKNSKGWIGYKLHMDVSDGGVPISMLLTSASLYDNQASIPLSEMTNKRVTNLYDLMDAAYDAKEIKEHSKKLGHVPIIDDNPRRSGKKKEMEPAKKIRFRERTTVERSFGRLKEEFGGTKVKVRGNAKVMAHLMFGVLVLSADQLLKFIN